MFLWTGCIANAAGAADPCRCSWCNDSTTRGHIPHAMIECCVAGTTRGCNDCLVSLQFGCRLHTLTLVAMYCRMPRQCRRSQPRHCQHVCGRCDHQQNNRIHDFHLSCHVQPHTDSVQLCCEHVFLHDSRASNDNEDNSTASGSAAVDTTSPASMTLSDLVRKKRKANPLKEPPCESPLAPHMRDVHRKAARLNVLR